MWPFEPKRKKRRRAKVVKRTGYPSFNIKNPDDPLPEPNMRWRRYISIGWVILNSALILFIVTKIEDASALRWVAVGLIIINVLVALLYMGGASAVDIARITAAGRLQANSLSIDTPLGTAQVGFQQTTGPDPSESA